MRKDAFSSLGMAASRVLASLQVEDRFLDDTGRPLSIDDSVQVTAGRSVGAWGTVVGLDRFDGFTGEPIGSDIVYIRFDGSDAVADFHPSRLRYIRRPA